MYSLMSSLTIASSFPNKISAIAFASSVLPTPVGPKNIKEAIGLLAADKPILPRLIDSAIDTTASSWSINLL